MSVATGVTPSGDLCQQCLSDRTLQCSSEGEGAFNGTLLCASIIEEASKQEWVIKCLFTALLLVIVVFFVHHYNLVQERYKMNEMAKDLVFERHRCLQYEARINILKKALQMRSDAQLEGEGGSAETSASKSVVPFAEDSAAGASGAGVETEPAE